MAFIINLDSGQGLDHQDTYQFTPVDAGWAVLRNGHEALTLSSTGAGLNGCESFKGVLQDTGAPVPANLGNCLERLWQKSRAGMDHSKLQGHFEELATWLTEIRRARPADPFWIGVI